MSKPPKTTLNLHFQLKPTQTYSVVSEYCNFAKNFRIGQMPKNVERFDCLQPQKKMLKWSISVRTSAQFISFYFFEVRSFISY